MINHRCMEENIAFTECKVPQPDPEVCKEKGEKVMKCVDET